MQTRANAARSSDTAKIREAMVHAFPTVELPTIKIDANTEFLAGADSKIGWKDLCTARLMVSIDDRQEFDADPIGRVNASFIS